jgi:hypothetical protein
MFSEPWAGLAGCICLGIAMLNQGLGGLTDAYILSKVHVAGRAGMENADTKALVDRRKWRKQGI